MEPLGEAIEVFLNSLPIGGSIPISDIKAGNGKHYTSLELLDAANYLVAKGLVFSNDRSKDGTVYGLTDLGEQMRTV